MSTEVELPDGTILDIETDDPNAAASAAKAYLAKQSPQPAAAPAPTPTPVGQRFLQGVKDVSLGTEQLAHRIAPLFPERAAAVDQRIKDLNAQYVPPEGVDWARMGGSALAGLPAAAALPAGSGLLGGAAAGLAAGALGGALSPVQDTQDFWSQKAQQAGIGAATGALGGGALGAIGSAIAPKVQPGVRELMSQGIVPTPGQILGGKTQGLEDMATSVPLIGGAIRESQRRAIEDFNKAALARAVQPLGVKPPTGVGREAVGQVRDSLDRAYDDILPKVTFKPDQAFSDELGRITASAAEILPDPQLKQFTNILRNKLVNKIGNNDSVSGDVYQGIDSELRRIADGLVADKSFDSRELGTHLRQVLMATRENLVRNNPDQASRLSDINRGYANYARVRDASGAVGADEGVFTPAQLSRAVRAGDKSAGKGNFATGRALMQDLSDPAKAVLSSTYPDSGTAGRLGLMGLLVGAPMYGSISPMTAIGAGLGVLPYLSPQTQKLAAKALTARPQGAATVRSALERLAPALLTQGYPLSGEVMR